MKELLEEKAKAYDEVREKIAIIFGSNVADEIFSQFEMSEDERIRKAMIKCFKGLQDEARWANVYGSTFDSIFAWLEKQGEQKEATCVSEIVDRLTPKEQEILFKELDMQKPTDKVESKFKDGEWITHNTANFVFKIINVGSNGYEVVNRENYKKTISFDNEDNYHLWTIQDAKDGDVLAFDDDTIVIFKDLYNSTTFHSYCHIEDGLFDVSKEDMPDWWEGKGFVPSTKEQRNLLFQKMKEAGYKWNAEKKELKKIKKEPAEWNEEDEKMIQDIINDIAIAQEQVYCKSRCEDEINWLKSLRPKSQWKPSEE